MLIVHLMSYKSQVINAKSCEWTSRESVTPRITVIIRVLRDCRYEDTRCDNSRCTVALWKLIKTIQIQMHYSYKFISLIKNTLSNLTGTFEVKAVKSLIMFNVQKAYINLSRNNISNELSERWLIQFKTFEIFWSSI